MTELFLLQCVATEHNTKKKLGKMNQAFSILLNYTFFHHVGPFTELYIFEAESAPHNNGNMEL